MTYVKICGITNLADALFAIDAGADMLGFNFYRPSPRYIEAKAARQIIDRLPVTVLNVGVFVNEASPALVEQIATEAGVAALQLHGDESPWFCATLKDRYVIKVFGAGDNFVPESTLCYDVQAIMLDAFDRRAHGGTGHAIDWSVARQTRDLVPKFFLAGGLSPENIAAAIAAVKPYAVDACSALESAPGKKDPNRVHAFIKAARLVKH
jgi:phosphoribosylanthranilate isomerase